MTTPISAIRYPLAIDHDAGRVAQETDHDQYVRQLIRQVLLTARGERINQPAFGAGVRRLIFSPNSPATASLAQTLVYQALSTWLPTLIRTEDVQVNAREQTLLIDVTYVVLRNQERVFLSLEVTP